MELNGDLKSKETAKKKKINAREPHLTVNQRLILDDVIDIIEGVIPIDIMEVRTITTECLKKWELETHMRISNLEKMPKEELKAAINKFFTYFEQIATIKLQGKVKSQEIKESLNKAREEYFLKYHPLKSTKRSVLYLGTVFVSIIAAWVLLFFVSSNLNIFLYPDFWIFPAFP